VKQEQQTGETRTAD